MKKMLTRNLGLKILAVVCAAFLWLAVVNIDDPVRSKTFANIDVEVTNEAVVTSKGRTYRILDNTDTVSVTVKAKQSVLQKIKADDIRVEANMGELTHVSMIPLEVIIDNYEGNYDKEGTYTTPLNLQVEIEENSSKKFPITPVETGTVRDGYVLGSMSVNPEQVTIRGPESVVNSIAKVQAEVNVNGLAADATVKSELIYYDGNDKVVNATLLTNNLGEEGVTVDVTINRIKEVSLKFDTSKITVAAGYYLGDVTYSPEEIKITGTKDALSSIKEISIPSEALILDQLTEKTEKMVDITPYLPDDVKLVDENAGTVLVTVNLEEGGVKTIDWSVGSISVRNAPEGLKLSYGDTEEIILRIRGTQAMLDKLNLTSEDVYIDLAEFKTPGKHSVKVEVKPGIGYSLVEDVVVEIELTGE